MGFLDRLLGREVHSDQPRASSDVMGRSSPHAPEDADARAIERYRYLLRTAPPETIEEAHHEAFEQLTPEQRQMVLRELTATLPEHERAAMGEQGDDPRSLARVATRAEMRQPGTMERTMNGMPGIGAGGMMAGTFFSGFAGIMVGSMVASAFLNDSGYDQQSSEGSDTNSNDIDGSGETSQSDSGAAGDQSAADSGGFESDSGAADAGGSDWGGGDFGGGDFGGGDFGGGGDF